MGEIWVAAVNAVCSMCFHMLGAMKTLCRCGK
ncbi:MAG: hypothetical protein MASP_00701 [Candidatus Methanolliviera sp. GoM_asphalt]|nr:MAG: hypothetical protein MASP_00701 [Candidatus Methanolliviera sp. GoM_asphalt]